MPFKRVTKREPCPICNHDHWCMVSTDGELAICPWTMEGSLKIIDGPKGFVGYLHQLKEAARPLAQKREPQPPRPNVDFQSLSLQCQSAAKDQQIDRLAKSLGLRAISLITLSIGWHSAWSCFTFPMRDHRRRVVGIRTRHADGSKKSINGSRAGLFIPAALKDKGTLYICEGPTDTAAMNGVRHDAIGRASCMGLHEEVKAYISQWPNRDIVILADNDGPGQDGARRLRTAINRGRIISPPNHVKDVRELAAERGVAEIGEAVPGYLEA